MQLLGMDINGYYWGNKMCMHDFIVEITALWILDSKRLKDYRGGFADKIPLKSVAFCPFFGLLCTTCDNDESDNQYKIVHLFSIVHHTYTTPLS